MKNLKLIMFVGLCMAVFTLSSCSDDDNINPEDTVKAALEAQYPNATRVEWERKGEYYVADCVINGKDTDVWYSLDAKWKMTETELRAEDIPAAVTAALAASEYATWRIDDRDLLEYPNREKEYVIEVEQGAKEVDIYFSESGKILRTNDVSGNDTHWPESKEEQAIYQALMAKYPKATRIEWERKGNYFIADCMNEGRELDVWFTIDAIWKMTETELRAEDIPAAVTTALAASEYAAWRIDDRDLLEYPAKAKEYVIEVEQGEKEMDLYFSESGTLLRTKDVSKGDDTHWPE